MSEAQDLMEAMNKLFRKEGKLTFDVLCAASSIQLQYIKTGSRALDRALGGGLARGRTVEFQGDLSTLKTFFAQKVLANAQELGMGTAIYDTEGSFEPTRAEALGVDTDQLLILNRQLRGDEGLDVVHSLLQQGNFCVVVDSVAALLPKAEAERRMGDDTMARQAALMSQAMRKLTQANQNGLCLFINQLRDNIGVSFGPKTRAPGGRALGFYATHRVKFTRIETLKDEGVRWIDGKPENVKVEVAQRIQARVEKSKVSRPFQEAVMLFDLTTGQLDEVEEVLNLGLELEVFKPDGTSYIWWDEKGEEQKVRFKSGIRKVISDNLELFGDRIDKEILRAIS